MVATAAYLRPQHHREPGRPGVGSRVAIIPASCNRTYTKANETNDFYYDGWRVREEHDAADAITQQYTYGNYLDEVWTLDNRRGGISVADLNDNAGAQRLFYHSNALYHVYALTDETGAIKEAIKGYDAYGKVVNVLTGAGTDTNWFTGDDVTAANSAVNNPYYYGGYRRDDETGLGYLDNRFYSYDLGRFMSRDPIGYVEGPNLYEYVKSKPTNDLDPVGLGDETICCAKKMQAWQLKYPTFDACVDDCWKKVRIRIGLGGAGTGGAVTYTWMAARGLAAEATSTLTGAAMATGASVVVAGTAIGGAWGLASSYSDCKTLCREENCVKPCADVRTVQVFESSWNPFNPEIKCVGYIRVCPPPCFWFTPSRF